MNEFSTEDRAQIWTSDWSWTRPDGVHRPLPEGDSRPWPQVTRDCDPKGDSRPWPEVWLEALIQRKWLQTLDLEGPVVRVLLDKKLNLFIADMTELKSDYTQDKSVFEQARTLCT